MADYTDVVFVTDYYETGLPSLDAVHRLDRDDVVFVTDYYELRTPVIPDGQLALADGCLNRVYNTDIGRFVTWKSYNGPDPSGTQYPGPGVFGINTTDYVVIATLSRVEMG